MLKFKKNLFSQKVNTDFICRQSDNLDLLRYKNNEITFWCPEETTPNGIINDAHALNQSRVIKEYRNFQQQCTEHNIQYNFVLGARNPIFNNKTWNNYFAYHSIYNNKQKLKKYVDVNTHFICMNGRLTEQRCRFIDNFAKNNLIKYSYFTCHNNMQVAKKFTTDLDAIEKEICNIYNWQHWQPKVFVLDDIKKWEERAPAHYIPKFYNRGACIVGTESKEHIVFVTEKFYNPVLHKRPCLLYAARDYYHTIWKKGYKQLIDVDYSFDSVEDNDKRLEMYLAELVKISKQNKQEFFDKQKEILEYNFNNYMKEILYTVPPKNLPEYYAKIVSHAKEFADKHYNKELW